MNDDAFALSRVLAFWGQYRDILCRVPTVLFTQNIVDLVNQFHQAVWVFFSRSFFAKALPTFIIAN